ncbi:MAG TPA: toll/interleukin-1 receptor domain-containing protein [Sphingomonas sp.]|nr:toll/interleukin-1 receptor domain-containing protein [Sphingomonas sp.]
MEHQPIAVSRSYSAFISYSHEDRRLAARLGARIERYRLPRQIARRVGLRRLKPVFRDREELVAAPDLAEAIHRAIVQADFLIVVCTPHATTSEWVAREIEMFRAAHGDDRILTALFAAPHVHCFPTPLLRRSDGTLVQPLAADFGPDGDGARLALLKIIAVLAGVGLDDLVQRDAQRQVRHVIATALGAFVVIAILAITAFLAVRARADAASERLRASDAVQSQLNLTPQVRSGATLRVAAALVAGVERQLSSATGGQDDVKHRLQSAEALQLKAEIDEKSGDFTAARARARSASALTAALIARDPDDWTIVFAHAQSIYWVGFTAWRSGDIATARRSFADYANLARELVRIDPANRKSRMELGYANSNLGMLALREEHDWDRARRDFTAAQDAFLAVGRQHPGDLDALYETNDGEAWLADLERLRGNYDGALRHRDAQRRILQRLLRDDPSNALYRVDLVTNQLGLARIASAQRRHDLATQQLNAAMEMVAGLKAADPENTSIARQERVITLFMVRNWLLANARHRPTLAAMTNMVGDCERDWREPASEELAAFCSLLQAQLAIARGDTAAARLILVKPRVATALASAALTPRWRLDFTQESRGAMRALGNTR